MQELSIFKANITSQWGEDGIIAEIFRRIGAGSKRCIEFGAWDGKHLSNIWSLWHEHGWAAVLIEADRERATELVKSMVDFPGVAVVNALVNPAGANTLDAILDRLGWQGDPDLLSIDIDGDDYHIFASLIRRPRVLIVEHNPTMPPSLTFVQRAGETIGSSAAAVLDLAHRSGYRLSGITETNSILVRNDEFPKLGIPELDLAACFPTSRLTPVVSAYDGRLFSVGKLAYAGADKAHILDVSNRIAATTSGAPIAPLAIPLDLVGRGRRFFRRLRVSYENFRFKGNRIK